MASLRIGEDDYILKGNNNLCSFLLKCVEIGLKWEGASADNDVKWEWSKQMAISKSHKFPMNACFMVFWNIDS